MFIGVGLVSLSGYAQQKHEKLTPVERAKKQGDEWQKRLGLTDDEKAKFVEAKTTQLTKLQALERNKENREIMKSSAADFENSIKTAFSTEHYDAWKKAKEEIRKNRQDKRGKRNDQDADGAPDVEK